MKIKDRKDHVELVKVRMKHNQNLSAVSKTLQKQQKKFICFLFVLILLIDYPQENHYLFALLYAFALHCDFNHFYESISIIRYECF